MLIFLFSALIVLCDQFFKRWIIITHYVGEETVLIPGVLSLFRLHNPGAAFGFLTNQPWWLLAAIQLLAAILLVMIILRYTEGFWGSLGLAAVLGGTIGNLIDRVFTFNEAYPHHVTDMFRFMFIDFAIFNVADIFITLGFTTFLIHFIIITFKTDKKKASAIKTANNYDEESDEEEYEEQQEIQSATVSIPISFEETSPPKNLTEVNQDASDIDVLSPFRDDVVSLPVSDAANKAVERQTQADVVAKQTQADATIEIAPLLDQIYGGEYLPPSIIAQHIHREEPSQTEDVTQSESADISISVAPEVLFTDENTIDLGPENKSSADKNAKASSPAGTKSAENTEKAAPSESLLDVLSSLESELLGDGSVDEYDVNKLLGEYGFKSDES